MIYDHTLYIISHDIETPQGQKSRGLKYFSCGKSLLSAASRIAFFKSNRLYYIFQTIHVYHTFSGLALFTDGLNKFSVCPQHLHRVVVVKS